MARGAWRVARGAWRVACGARRLIRAVFNSNFLECLQPDINPVLLFRVDISGLQIMEYFSCMHKLHFLVTFEYNSACFTLRLLLVHWPFLSSNKCVACFVPFAVK